MLQGRRLVGVPEGPANCLGGQADVELLAYFTIGVGDDVPGIGVDAYQSRDLNIESGLLANLAHSALGDRLAELQSAPGQRPVAAVGSAKHKHSASIVGDDRRSGHGE